jgi:4-coumarate--CoA ligase
LSHANVSDAAVIGVPAGNEGSEMPRAYVVVKPGSQLIEEEVQNHIKERLAGYKQLTGGVRFVDSIPKNASGKILKKDLKAIATKEMGARL